MGSFEGPVGGKMSALWVILSVLTIGILAEDYKCPTGRSFEEITIEAGDSFGFKTQSTKKYKKNVSCWVKYKRGESCSAINFSCKKVNIKNQLSDCNEEQDLLYVGEKKFCGLKKPDETFRDPNFMVSFFSDRTKNGIGARCTVKCLQTETQQSSTNQEPDTFSPLSAVEDTCKCGKAKRFMRIVGGEVTEKHEYPWQAGFVTEGEPDIWCGGSLISNQWVLTAAHCLDGDWARTTEVVLGEHNYELEDESIHDEMRQSVAEIIIHPQWDTDTKNYDFALVKLKNPIVFSKHPHIRPVCLPDKKAGYFEDERATVTGWGSTRSGGWGSAELLEVTLSVVSPGACRSKYSPHKAITEQMICASDPGKDACQGDSGGPLVVLDSETYNYQLAGVVSWGIGCASARFPGVYARVTEGLDWIKKNTGLATNKAATCPR